MHVADSDMFRGCVRNGTYRGIQPICTTGITGPGRFGKFGTTSIPVPDTSVISVQHQYRYLRYQSGCLYRSWYRYRYNIFTGTDHCGKFGTKVPGKSLPHTGHIGNVVTTYFRYHHIVTSKYGRFLCDAIPTFRIFLFDLVNGSVFPWCPISQYPMG